jgi:phosphoenolpyruvate carboxylase
MILAKTDPAVARQYADFAAHVPGAGGFWKAIAREYGLSVSGLLAVTGRERLLDGVPVLRQSIDLRNPYIDSLSEIQVQVLARLRALPLDDPDRERLLALVHVAVNGVAAGLQNTG